MKIRITIPWHQSVLVKTKALGTYCVQFVNTLPGGPTAPGTVSIVALPKLAEGSGPPWDMSGYFGNQDQAIYAWENGFEVIPRDDEEGTTIVEEAVLKAMLRSGLAKSVEE
jgi:hypothetical protein